MNEDNVNPRDNAQPFQQTNEYQNNNADTFHPTPPEPAPTQPINTQAQEPSPPSLSEPVTNTIAHPEPTPTTTQSIPTLTTQPIPATSANSTRYEYNSNPFIAAGKGLGSALFKNPVASLLIAIVPIVALFVFGFFAGLLGAMLGPIVAIILMVVLLIAGIIILIRVSAASVIILLESNNGNSVTTKEAIGPLSSKHLTSFFLTSLLVGILVFFGLLLFVVPGIFLISRLSLAPVLVYAEGLKTMSAIKRSIQLTKGHAFEMLGAVTAQAVLSSNGLLATIGANSGVARRYFELTNLEKAGGVKTTKTHWLNFVMPSIAVIFVIVYVGALITASKNQPDYSNDFYYQNYNSTNLDDFNSNYEYDTNTNYFNDN